MSEVTLALPETKEVSTQPVYTMLEPTTTNTCDGCGEAVIALIEVCLPPSEKLPAGGSLVLCAHHGRKMGFDVWWPEENKLIGSSN